MSHTMHLEEGVILDSNAFGESGRFLKILTVDYGIKTVAATGVREIKSKMRGSLDILQIVDFEYVEGREINRLIGIHPKKKFSNIYTVEKRRVLSNIINFIMRTVVGETNNQKLYSSFLEGLEAVNSTKETNFEDLEIIWLIKILVSLGYWSEGKMDDYTEENFKSLADSEFKKQVTEEINKSIKSTHL